MKENDYIERYKKLAGQVCNARHHGVFNLKSLASPYDVIVDTAITLLSNDSLEESKEQGVVIEDVFKYPSLMEELGYMTKTVKHKTFHTQTSEGAFPFSKPRRLDPVKYKIAKAKFELLLKTDICRPFNSSVASPLHLTSKMDPNE
ncbi:hypothetical protein GQX74_015515 [Glossina fuscipes]|nr:hypothetical protein GQX74_015515 [Glossina fuscipes]